MIYRRFGKTNLKMPVFSCGGMRYQYKWDNVPMKDIPADNQANLEATIRRSVDLGINHIETARGYGSSEMQLGDVLPTLPRDKIIVQTKVGPSEDPKQFLETFDKSMSLLKLDHVDLLSIHGINTHELLQWSCRPNGCLAAARKLQKQGRCRHVGFSTHAGRDVILDAINHEGDGGFDYVNLHWYYIFQRNWAAIEAAKKRDLGVFIISPSDKGGKLYAPPEKLVELCKPLHPIVFNDLFCLARPEVHTLSVGAARPNDFDRHIETLPLLEKAGEILPPIIARLKAAMREATGNEDPEALCWTLPEHEKTPGGMNLPVTLWLRNLALGWDMSEYGKMRYGMFGNGGHWFPGQKVDKLSAADLAQIDQLAAGSPLGPKVRALLQDAHERLGGTEAKRLSTT
ncbi:MAG: aldo/keto reductase [Planctomycetota bacterium]|nr:aldo/keto reductase [Planctomycetota bacterium]